MSAGSHGAGWCEELESRATGERETGLEGRSADDGEARSREAARQRIASRMVQRPARAAVGTAERLRGHCLPVPVGELAEPDDGEGFLHARVGLQAVHRDGTPLCRVVGVHDVPQRLRFKGAHARGPVLVPFGEGIIVAPAPAGGTIMRDPLHGHFEVGRRMLNVNSVTIFPEVFTVPLGISNPAKAAAGSVTCRVVELRDCTLDRHQTVDDHWYDGGRGMALKPDPLS